jgi:hypothetical protein
MKLLAYFHSLAATLFIDRRPENEIEEELRLHIEHRADDLERSGLAIVGAAVGLVCSLIVSHLMASLL